MRLGKQANALTYLMVLANYVMIVSSLISLQTPILVLLAKTPLYVVYIALTSYSATSIALVIVSAAIALPLIPLAVAYLLPPYMVYILIILYSVLKHSKPNVRLFTNPLYFTDLILIAAASVFLQNYRVLMVIAILVANRLYAVSQCYSRTMFKCILFSIEPLSILANMYGKRLISVEEHGLRLGSVKAVIDKKANIIALVMDEPYILPLSVKSTPHILILGATGTGKSTILKAIVREAARNNLSIVLIDPHGEHRNIASNTTSILEVSRQGIDIMDFSGLRLADHINFIVSFFKKSYGIGPRQEYLLREALREAYYAHGYSEGDTVYKEPVDPKDLVKLVMALGRHEPTAFTLARYIDDLIDKLHGKQKIGELKEGTILVVSLEGLSEDELALAIEYVLRHIFFKAQQKGLTDKPRILVAIDEVQHVASKQKTIPTLKRMFNEGRKYGIIVVAATQKPSILDETIISNTSTLLLLPLHSFRDFKLLVEGTVFADYTRASKLYNLLEELDKGYMLALHRSSMQAYIVRTP